MGEVLQEILEFFKKEHTKKIFIVLIFLALVIIYFFLDAIIYRPEKDTLIGRDNKVYHLGDLIQNSFVSVTTKKVVVSKALVGSDYGKPRSDDLNGLSKEIDGIEIDDNAKILNGYSYVMITYEVKNKKDYNCNIVLGSLYDKSEANRVKNFESDLPKRTLSKSLISNGSIDFMSGAEAVLTGNQTKNITVAYVVSDEDITKYIQNKVFYTAVFLPVETTDRSTYPRVIEVSY